MGSSDRPEPAFSQRTLIRIGISNLPAAEKEHGLMTDKGWPAVFDQPLLTALDGSASPDAALRALSDLIQQDVCRQRILSCLDGSRGSFASEGAASSFSRLIALLGSSPRIARLIEADPTYLDSVIGTDYDSHSWGKRQRIKAMQAALAKAEEGFAGGVRAFRHEYWKEVIAIAASDVSDPDPFRIQPTISSRLSDLVDSALQAAVQVSREAVPRSGEISFAIIGMGKLGAQEINYVSDVDLVYVAEPARHPSIHNPSAQDSPDQTPALSQTDLVSIGTALGASLQKACQNVLPSVGEPPLWKVDCALRPEGKAGPLVRTIGSHLDYYRNWAENWEFQALLKARFVAGDEDLGRSYIDQTRPLVWSASARKNFVFDCRAMRERVEKLIPDKQKDLEIKLGQGGLRDVEFTVQMLQLVHGRTDESLRLRSTLEALKALAQGGYVSRKQAADLSEDYRFERVMEHRQQLWQMRRTHLFPDLGQASRGGLERPRNMEKASLYANEDLTRLARSFGLSGEDLVTRFDRTRRQVRSLHMDIYYRPMLGDISGLADDEIRLPDQALRERFHSIGFSDPQAASLHVRALTRGVSRAAKINKILLPAILLWLSQGQNPDMGLLQWRKLVEKYGRGGPFLGFLRDSPMAAQRLCHILSNSRYLSDALTRSAESVTWLGADKDLRPHTRSQLDTRALSAYLRFDHDLPAFSQLIRAMRRREIERIGLGWMSSVISSQDCLTSMTDVYDAAIESSLLWAIRNQCRQRDLEETQAPASICLIAMGRYGGREVNFSSDADLMMIYEEAGTQASDGQAASFAKAVVADMRAILGGGQTTEAKIDLDFDLRPEGKNGPLIRSYPSYKDYYAHWAQTWEHQALLRARYAAGDRKLADRFLTEVADPLRYPRTDLTEAQLTEIRTLKARMEAERLPRGLRRDRHLKLGKGGLSDVEWTIQLLQLTQAGTHPQLRTTSTLEALKALEEADLIAPADAKVLEATWRLCTDARNASFLWSGRVAQADVIPEDSFSLGGTAACMGWSAHEGQEFVNELLHDMRLCRQVTERLFYGE